MDITLPALQGESLRQALEQKADTVIDEWLVLEHLPHGKELCDRAQDLCVHLLVTSSEHVRNPASIDVEILDLVEVTLELNQCYINNPAVTLVDYLDQDLFPRIYLPNHCWVADADHIGPKPYSWTIFVVKLALCDFRLSTKHTQ